jgi:hypothetical protein
MSVSDFGAPCRSMKAAFIWHSPLSNQGRVFDGRIRRNDVIAARAEKKFSFGFKLIPPVQSHLKKYSASRLTQITSIFFAIPPHSRGVSRSSRTRGGMRWTRAALLTRAASCGRRSRVVLTPRRWRSSLRSGVSALTGLTRCAGDGDKKARSPGRARKKPLKPLRREGRVSRRTCGDYSCAFYLCTRGCGCGGHPAFPAPSVFFEGRSFLHNSGASRREIAKSYSNVIACDKREAFALGSQRVARMRAR